jgi:hypothetical protein
MPSGGRAQMPMPKPFHGDGIVADHGGVFYSAAQLFKEFLGAIYIA